MKASKFWITATAAVATAGTIGLAIAQQMNPQQPAPDAQSNTAGQSLATPGSGTNATGNASRNSGSTSTNLDTTNSSSDAASSNTVAKADRG